MPETGDSEMSNQRFHSKFTVISSQRGNDLLLYNGYKYNKQRVNLNGHTVWRCSKRKKCNVTLIIKKMPSYENLKKTLYKHRLKALQAKRTRFHRVEKVEVPGVFKQFLLADYMEKKNRVLIFASPKGRETLKTAKHFFGDGTFKICYAFLPNKKQKTYEIMFNLLKSQVPEMNPKTFTTDYESSAMLAIRETFRDVKSQGCFFHFSRACWRKAEKLGLRKTKILKSHVRRAISLAYLPKDFVMDGWLYVKGETDSNYYFGLLRQKGFISKKRAETIITQRKIEHCVQELCDGEISVGYCIEKLSNI
ncbi:hypothetical protein ABMA27_002207 [Loxostege sticticalis]|uniref:MULE transposase domain-containing protein n=1 Tax=Loxostege sticticalis TaxID=481309 RepID=A0ABR3HWZ0_LOXSC